MVVTQYIYIINLLIVKFEKLCIIVNYIIYVHAYDAFENQ